MFMPSVCRDITKTDGGKSLESPMECNEILFTNWGVIVIRTRNPSIFLKASWFIQKEPEARNQMSQEDDWTKDENDLSNRVTEFKSFRNTGEFGEFKNSKQLEQPENSKQSIQSWQPC